MNSSVIQPAIVTIKINASISTPSFHALIIALYQSRKKDNKTVPYITLHGTDDISAQVRFHFSSESEYRREAYSRTVSKQYKH